jgi:hypothetical protein
LNVFHPRVASRVCSRRGRERLREGGGR